MGRNDVAGTKGSAEEGVAAAFGGVTRPVSVIPPESSDDECRAAQKAIQWMPDDLENYGPNTEFVVARREEELVGVVVFGPADSDSLAVTVYALGVEAVHHRKGIGSLLKILVMGSPLPMTIGPAPLVLRFTRETSG